jgi:hypothetical protein
MLLQCCSKAEFEKDNCKMSNNNKKENTLLLTLLLSKVLIINT